MLITPPNLPMLICFHFSFYAILTSARIVAAFEFFYCRCLPLFLSFSTSIFISCRIQARVLQNDLKKRLPL